MSIYLCFPSNSRKLPSYIFPIEQVLPIYHSSSLLSILSLSSCLKTKDQKSITMAAIMPESSITQPLAPHTRPRAMSSGTIKTFDASQGQGWIRPSDGGRDVHFHLRNLKVCFQRQTKQKKIGILIISPQSPQSKPFSPAKRSPLLSRKKPLKLMMVKIPLLSMSRRRMDILSLDS